MEHYEFTEEKSTFTAVEAFRGLEQGDVILLPDHEKQWEVRSFETVSGRKALDYIAHLKPAGEESPEEWACVDYRCVPDAVEGTEFYSKNAEGEWGYEDDETGLFRLVSMAERPDYQEPAEGESYYDDFIKSRFEVVEVGEFEVTVDYASDHVTVDSISRLIFSLRREWREYQPIRGD